MKSSRFAWLAVVAGSPFLIWLSAGVIVLASGNPCNKRYPMGDPLACDANWAATNYCGHWDMQVACTGIGAEGTVGSGETWQRECSEPGTVPSDHCVYIPDANCKQKYYCTWNPDDSKCVTGNPVNPAAYWTTPKGSIPSCDPAT